MDRDGIAYVLGDHSERGLSPEGWWSKAVSAAQAWGADCVVVEKNQGGDMATSVLKTADPRCRCVPSTLATAKATARADGDAVRDRKGTLCRAFPELEDQLCAMIRGGGYAGARSPDRAGAMVHAVTELMLGPVRAEPRVRRL